MHATQITTNTKKHIILGKTFYVQTKELANPRLHDIKGLHFFKKVYFFIFMF